MAADADAIRLDSDFIAADADDDAEEEDAAASMTVELVAAAVAADVIVAMVGFLRTPLCGPVERSSCGESPLYGDIECSYQR